MKYAIHQPRHSLHLSHFLVFAGQKAVAYINSPNGENKPHRDPEEVVFQVVVEQTIHHQGEKSGQKPYLQRPEVTVSYSLMGKESFANNRIEEPNQDKEAYDSQLSKDLHGQSMTFYDLNKWHIGVNIGLFVDHGKRSDTYPEKGMIKEYPQAGDNQINSGCV